MFRFNSREYFSLSREVPCPPADFDCISLAPVDPARFHLRPERESSLLHFERRRREFPLLGPNVLSSMLTLQSFCSASTVEDREGNQDSIKNRWNSSGRDRDRTFPTLGSETSCTDLVSDRSLRSGRSKKITWDRLVDLSHLPSRVLKRHYSRFGRDTQWGFDSGQGERRKERVEEGKIPKRSKSGSLNISLSGCHAHYFCLLVVTKQNTKNTPFATQWVRRGRHASEGIVTIVSKAPQEQCPVHTRLAQSQQSEQFDWDNNKKEVIKKRSEGEKKNWR